MLWNPEKSEWNRQKVQNRLKKTEGRRGEEKKKVHAAEITEDKKLQKSH